ncbi:MAG: hypothetical protein EPO24_03300 [Bacteroidetes bacterium]|nr:MAG: hypothetical protein EPO24_03300 [Bacteroidota bacterium]
MAKKKKEKTTEQLTAQVEKEISNETTVSVVMSDAQSGIVSDETIDSLFLSINYISDDQKKYEIALFIESCLNDWQAILNPHLTAVGICERLNIPEAGNTEKLEDILIPLFELKKASIDDPSRTDITLSVRQQVELDVLIAQIKFDENSYNYHNEKAKKYKKSADAGKDDLVRMNEAVLHPNAGLPLFEQEGTESPGNEE